MNLYFYSFVSFFIHGLLSNTFIIRLTSVFLEREFSAQQISSILITMGLTSMLSSSFLGSLVARFGDKAIFIFTTLLAISITPFMQFLPIYLFYPYVSSIAICVTSMDIAMNNQANTLEKVRNLQIMAKSHGFWSVGAISASNISYLLAKFNLSPFYHFCILLPFFLGMLWYTTSKYIKANDEKKEVSEEINETSQITSETDNKQSKTLSERISSIIPTMPFAIFLLSLIGLMFAAVEGTMADWTIIVATKEKGLSYQNAILVLAMFQTGMTIMRLSGDKIRRHLSVFQIIMMMALVSCVGVSIFLFTSNMFLMILGDFLIGIAIALNIPVLIVLVSNYDLQNAPKNIGKFFSLAYSVSFLAPGIIGFLATFLTITQSLFYMYVAIFFGTVCYIVYHKKYEK